MVPDQPSIRTVRATPVIVPVSPPVETSAGTVQRAPLVLIDVETAAGVVGTAYVFCYTTHVLGAVTRLVTTLGEHCVGQVLAPRHITQRLRKDLRLLGSEGLVGMALGGIDMALWDALARGAGVPLATLLGGAPHPVRAYCSLRGASPDAIAAETDDAIRAGFRAVKIRIGDRNERRDLAAVDAACDVLRNVSESSDGGTSGSQTAHLMVDYNQALAPLSAQDAARRIRRVAEHADGLLTWVEEPLAASDDVRHAALGARIDVPIQLGENWEGIDSIRRAIAAGTADIMMIDVMKIGGVSGWLASAAIAEMHERPLSSHLFPEVSLHLLAVSPVADWVEILDLAAPIRHGSIPIRDGTVTATNAPGHGLDWDADAVQRFRAT